jgi:hypothetical protein
MITTHCATKAVMNAMEISHQESIVKGSQSLWGKGLTISLPATHDGARSREQSIDPPLQSMPKSD